MVRPADKRLTVYKGKIEPDVVRSRFAALKDYMGAEQEVRQSEIAKIQADIKGILDTNGVAPTLVVPFMRLAMRLYGLSRKHSELAFENEAKFELDKEYNRLVKSGMAEARVGPILTAIAKYFNITWSPPAGS